MKILFSALISTIICKLSQGHVETSTDDIILQHNYNKAKPPSSVSVKFFFHPANVISVSAKTMDFSVDGAYRAQWSDDRINLSSNNSFQKIKLNRFFMEKLWQPVFGFKNCKGCRRQLFELTEDVIFTSQNNEITYTTAREENFICRFNMSFYPFDIQKCNIQIELINSPLDLSVTIFPEAFRQLVVPPEFVLTSLRDYNCTRQDGRFVCHSFEFTLRRVRTRPILLIFFPSLLIVAISWISFWLDSSLAAPRVALGLTSMLTLVTHFNTAQRDLPSVSTIMALDVWMFCCIFTVFSSLVEFSFVSFCKGKNAQKPPVTVLRNKFIKKK